MLIHDKLPQGSLYPQLTQAPTSYADFLNFFRFGQTIDDNTLLTTADTLQTNMFKVAIANGHLRRQGNPIQGEFLVDIFLTEKGAESIPHSDKELCQMAVELAKQSIPEADGKPHPYVGAVIVKDGKVLATGFRGESGEGGDHAEFCALKKLGDDVNNVDLSGCTVYTTLEPCSNRKSQKKTACAARLIHAKVERVVFGMADKDESVYGHVSLQEANIDVDLFPKECIRELVALNKAWSDTRRQPETPTLPNDSKPIGGVEYYKPGTSMEGNIRFSIRPPDRTDRPYTIEDASRNVVTSAKTLQEIAVEWRAMDARKTAIEGFIRQTSYSSHPLLSLT